MTPSERIYSYSFYSLLGSQSGFRSIPRETLKHLDILRQFPCTKMIKLITSEVQAISRAWSVLLKHNRHFSCQCFLVFSAQPQPDSKQCFQDLSLIQRMKCFCLLPRCISATTKDNFLSPSLRPNDGTGRFSIYVKMRKPPRV